MADRKLSFLLSGGVDNRSADELTAPVVQPGSAPKLVRCTNARLGVVPGNVVRSPLFTSVTSTTEPTRVRAIVSAAAGRSTRVLSDQDFRSLGGSILDAGRKAPGLTLGGGGSSVGVSSILPVQVTASRSLGSARAVSQYAIAYHATSGILYYAYIANDGDNVAAQLDRLMLAGVALDGTAVLAATEVATFTPGMSRWVGLTEHGANGVRLWYQNVATGSVCYRAVTYSAPTVTVGAENVVLLPGSITYSIDVVRGDDTYAMLAHSRVGTAADGSITKVNITNNTFASTNIVNALNGGGHVAVQCASPEGTARVAVVFASTTAVTAVVRCYTFSTMALVSTSGSQACDGRVSVGFIVNDALSSSAVTSDISAMLERSTAMGLGSTEPGVDHFLVDLAAGTSGFVARQSWYRIAGRAAQWTVSGQMMHAVHQLVPRRATTLETPGAANYTDDPSLDLFFTKTQSNAGLESSLLARLGVVRGGSSPVDHIYNDRLCSSSLVCVGDELYAAYRLLADYSSAANGAARGRLTQVSLGAGAQFPIAHDRDGCAFLAGAVPVQWDGVGLSEFGGPVQTPQLFADVGAFVLGTLLPAGTYSFQAVLYWTDASGLTHRSRPSTRRTVTVTGAEYVGLTCARVYTSVPSNLEGRIYATTTNGTTLHLMAVVNFKTILGKSAFVTGAALVTTANPQLYSGGTLGEEIVPQPPPPAWDIAIVGPRCWILDAEIRSRAVHSKLRVAGVGYEFAPAFEVIFGSGAGNLMAVREWQGMPLFLTERAAYQVSGDGPSNTLGGSGSFSAPVKVSDLGCTNTASVVTFPGGIMWQSGSRFVVLDGQGLRLVPDFDCTHDVSAALCLTRFGEVLFFSATTAEVRVYHYEQGGKWTTWDQFTLPELVQAAHVLPWDADAAILQLGSGPTTFKRLDANSISAATYMILETDWILLGGDFQDHITLQSVVFNGRLSGTNAGLHDLSIELFLDYETSASTIGVWTSAELDAIDVNGRYTVPLEVGAKFQCRAFKLRITDARVSGAGLSPRSVTVVYSVDGILFEEAFVAGSRR